MLALAAPRPVSRAELISLLWSRRSPQQAKGSLRQALHELQGSLRPLGAAVLDIDRTQVALRNGGVEVDVRLRNTDGPDPPADRPTLLEDLSGIDPAFDAWLAAERRNLARRARAKAETALRAADNPQRMAEAAEALLAIDRDDEAAWQALIRAHLDQGDRAAALTASEQCRAALAASGQHALSAPTTALLAVAESEPLRDVSSAADILRPLGLPAAARGHGGRLRVGVAQLRSLAGGVAGELAAGLAEELTAALTRFRWLACVPMSALRTAFGESWPGAASRQAQQLDFLLDGTVQQSDERIRVLIQLLDLRSVGEVVWSARFDRNVASILDLQDDIAGEAVAQLEPKLLFWEGERAATLSRGNPVARDLFHAAIPHLFRFERTDFRIAGERFEWALRLDPDNPLIHTWLAQWHLFLLGQGWSDDPSGAAARALELASTAVSLASDDARALTVAAHVRGFIEKRPGEALALLERSIAANPNLPLAWCRSADALSYAGQHSEALRRAMRARSLAPHDPFGFLYEDALAVPHLLLGEYETAARLGARAIAMNPGFSSSYKTHLAALGHLGRREQAAEIRARLLALDPNFSLSVALERSPIRRAEDRARYADGLRLGGLR